MAKKHGMYGTPTYVSWYSMKGRCNGRLSTPAYYKDKGITYCESWSEFINFYADMGVRPEGHTLDRIDSSKGYEKSNCKWSTKIEQVENRSNTVFIELDGVKKSRAEWSRITGLSRGAIEERLKRNWPAKDVLNPALNFRYVKNGILKKTRSAIKLAATVPL